MNFLRSFFDNDSVFGRLMTRCGIIIAANLMFLLFSIPGLTIGASWTALHYTMMKMLREKEINPIKTFWSSFRRDFKQSTFAFLGAVLLLGTLMLELFWCSQFTGVLSWFTYGLLAILLVSIVLCIYLFPVIAAFCGGLRQHIQSSLYFALHRPLDLVLIAAVHIVPMVVTYLNQKWMPLYAFLWFFVGFAAVAVFTDNLLLKQFLPYLESGAETDSKKTEAEILRDMEQLEF